MEQIPGWIKQWHQQMPSWRKEGVRRDEGSALRTTQEMKDAYLSCCGVLQLRLVPPSNPETVVIPQADPAASDFGRI